MGDYLRTMRECTLDSLRPELVAAIRKYIEKHELGALEPAVFIGLGPESAGQKFREILREALKKA